MTSSSPTDPIVIDAGVGYALCVMDAATSSLRAELASTVEKGAVVCAPTLWRYEVTSILAKAVHFRQLSLASAQLALHLASELAIQLVPPDDDLVNQAFAWTHRLQRASAYDSFYLALARRLDCPLWTVDRRLANAVSAPWVRFVGLASAADAN